MIRLLGVVFLFLLLIGGFGFWLGWFSFSKTSDGQITHIGVSVDRAKLESDREFARRKLDELGERKR